MIADYLYCLLLMEYLIFMVDKKYTITVGI